MSNKLSIEVLEKGESRACFPELTNRSWEHLQMHGAIVIQDGTKQGRPSVVIVGIHQSTGQPMVIETTGRLLQLLAEVVKAKDLIGDGERSDVTH